MKAERSVTERDEAGTSPRVRKRTPWVPLAIFSGIYWIAHESLSRTTNDHGLVTPEGSLDLRVTAFTIVMLIARVAAILLAPGVVAYLLLRKLRFFRGS